MHRSSFGRLAAAMAFLASPLAYTHGDASHAPMPHMYVASEVVATAFGRQGDPDRIDRTVTVDMTDNMRFTPDVLRVRRGDTIRLNVVNKGRVLHELVLGTPADIQAHWQAMQNHPGMAHEQPQSAHVAAGSQGEIVWQFTRPGEFQFACLLPGHFEAGMSGKVVVE